MVLPIVGLATLGILVFTATNGFASLLAKLLIFGAGAALLLWVKSAAQKPPRTPASAGRETRAQPTYQRIATNSTAVLLGISVASDIHRFGFPSGALEWLIGLGGLVITAAVLWVVVTALCWVIGNAWALGARLVRRGFA